MDVERELQRGIAFHGAGELGNAARCYQAVLQHAPGNVDALNLMSALATLAGQPELAADLARQAIAGDEGFFAAYLNLGNALQVMGDAAGAVEAFRRGVSLNPQSAEGFSNLASALGACGRFAEANDAAVRALALNPDLAEAHNNFGNALRGLGSPAEAVECYEKAVEINPDFVEAWQNMGNARLESGDADGALEALLRALELEPNAARFHDLGTAFLALGQFEEAARGFAQAIDLDGTFQDAWMNLSVALKSLGRLAEAEAVQRDAVALSPEDAEAHFNLAVLLLQQGKFEEGWAEYEWRWRLADFRALARDFDRPRWTGEDFAGRTLLLTAEQGFGDALEFARFVPLAAARGGRVVVECRPGLERLLATVDGCAEVAMLGSSLPPFDLHLPLMSLPGVLGVTLETLPAAVPYLAVPGQAADLPDVAAKAGLKVGVAWAGKASRRDNRLRSCGLDDFAPLLEMEGVQVFSLQVGPSAGLGPWAGRDDVHDLAPRLGDFADTAAAIARLDMVVSVDTAVAHLAGALGKPVWVLLSRPSNAFLWMEDRGDSPWYPTARLFRQPAPGDWSGLMAEIRRELEKLRP
jgi:Tfp pilus assembly protein PilF